MAFCGFVVKFLLLDQEHLEEERLYEEERVYCPLHFQVTGHLCRNPKPGSEAEAVGGHWFPIAARVTLTYPLYSAQTYLPRHDTIHVG